MCRSLVPRLADHRTQEPGRVCSKSVAQGCHEEESCIHVMITVFCDTTACGLIDTAVSEEPAGSIFRVATEQRIYCFT
jgi:hypothetical protein